MREPAPSLPLRGDGSASGAWGHDMVEVRTPPGRVEGGDAVFDPVTILEIPAVFAELAPLTAVPEDGLATAPSGLA